MLGLALTSGCGTTEFDATGRTSLPVEGGEIDSERTAVFRVITRSDGFNGLCSSTLIAPNLLLTARHCVAANEGDDIDCARTEFGAPTDPRNLLFSNEVAPDLDSQWFSAEHVAVPDGSTLFCGNDIALVRLRDPIPASVAEPLPPSLTEPTTAGQPYVAVGYGASDRDGDSAEYGVRRFRDELRVDCVGRQCQDEVFDSEFAGLEGVCRGDSGGPALDAEGRILGALSRGRAGCESPVYTAVFAYRDWLVAEAERASAEAELALPEWAGGEPERARERNDAGAGPTASEPSAPPLDAEGGCTVGNARGGGLWLALPWLVLMSRRRQSSNGAA